MPRYIAEKKEEWLSDLMKPINITINEIRKDMRMFETTFPKEKIPVSSDAEKNQKQFKKNLLKQILAGEEIRFGDSDDEFI